MRRIIIIALILFCGNAMGQQCPQWNSTTYYQQGDRVLYNGKAWEALVMIWYWPPPHPIYWKEIPMSSCAGTSCILKLKLHSQGSVTVDSMPTGGRGVLDSTGPARMDLTYAYGKTVTLTATPHTGYKFRYWNNGASNPVANAIAITLTRDTLIEPVFARLGLCTLVVNLTAHGSVVFDTLPDGKVRTFNNRDTSRGTYIYNENTRLMLIAIPDSGYTFSNWGDAGHTTGKAVPLVMNLNYTFSPVFQTGATSWSYPKNCYITTNMKVDGRTRLYAYSDLLNGGTVCNTINIKDQSGYGEVSNITSDNIWVGNSFITRNGIYSPSINCRNISTKSLQTSNGMKVDNCVTGKVRVTANAFPDYVFETGYHLKSLPEVEKYITENHHLEDIPTAAEIKENKADLGDLYVGMLRKVEESMLYIVELQKRVDSLKNCK